MARGVSNNVYTVLSVIALAAMITAAIVLFQATTRVFGPDASPLKVNSPSMVMPILPG